MKNTLNIQLITSKALQDLFYQYTHLPLGGKEIVCPYWMNKLDRKIYGPGGGKGRPEEIVRFTEIEAKRQNVDLKQLSEGEISGFMKTNRIGVDCSGFAFWVLDALDVEKGGNGIDDDIPGSKGNKVKANANVKMLTDDSICKFIDETGKIRPGDMLRFRGGKHMAIVISLVFDSSEKIREIIYAHSSSEAYGKTTGVHQSKILVVNQKLGLRQQKWLEQTCSGSSYSQYIWPEKGDGIKRLLIWK